jgi:hypothetical protein
MKNEDKLMSWLEANGLPTDQLVVSTFTEAGFSGEDLETLNNVPKDDLAQICLIENYRSQELLKTLQKLLPESQI